ncbi:UBX domain-containing protein 1-like isoform X2 [Acropora millepora]|uniref:UBX domain-containing protein 1-like isoform X2 n=1 Tax=Acropora millepora TaxID=45264 RepID=UPI001CF110F8|nr:UBX domain-containing protein 1-like isoform X2 [Acropora millepora]
MENALDAFRAISGTDEAKNALSLIQVYFNNIVKDPQNQKFRRIRISNPKFYSSIWQLEQARTFLLLSGFEQEGEFLVLPSSIKLDGTKLLLDEAFGVSSANEARKHKYVSGSLHTNDKSTVLKLNSQKVDSLFDQDIKADLTLLSYMKEMGYNVTAAEKALIATKNEGVQPAIDWINQNPYEEIVKLKQVEVVPQENTEGTSKFPNNSNTFDSGAHVQPAPVSRYQKTIAERHKFQEKVRLEAIEEAKLEKQRKKLQREYLLKDLKDEKDEKLEKAKHAKLAAESSSETSTYAAVDQTVHDGESLLIDLKIRLPDGEVLSISLSSDSTIETLYQEVRRLWPENGEQQVSRDFVLMTSFPQRRITDMENSLASAGLGRRAALVVQRLHEQESDSNNG